MGFPHLLKAADMAQSQSESREMTSSGEKVIDCTILNVFCFCTILNVFDLHNSECILLLHNSKCFDLHNSECVLLLHTSACTLLLHLHLRDRPM